MSAVPDVDRRSLSLATLLLDQVHPRIVTGDIGDDRSSSVGAAAGDDDQLGDPRFAHRLIDDRPDRVGDVGFLVVEPRCRRCTRGAPQTVFGSGANRSEPRAPSTGWSRPRGPSVPRPDRRRPQVSRLSSTFAPCRCKPRRFQRDSRRVPRSWMSKKRDALRRSGCDLGLASRSQ
jgi:hypothetical protein